MSKYVILNKPFQVLCQFTDTEGRSTLADFVKTPGIYSAGRLDYDSEGLLVLTDDGDLIHGMMDPKFKVAKTYLAQVEGVPDEQDLKQFRLGLTLKDGKTRPAKISIVEEPAWLWERTPHIRDRKHIATSWLEIEISEGKNRQVRRMTAAINCPTLRLIRYKIGSLSLKDLGSGDSKQIDKDFILDNGISWKPKKSNPKAAFHGKSKTLKRSDQHPLRNRRSQTQIQKDGKTQPGNR